MTVKRTSKTKLEQQTMFDDQEVTQVAEEVAAAIPTPEAIEQAKEEMVASVVEALTGIAPEEQPETMTMKQRKELAKKAAQERREEWIADRENKRNKFDSLQAQANQWIQFVEEFGETEEAKQLAYEFMYRRYFSGEFDPIRAAGK